VLPQARIVLVIIITNTKIVIIITNTKSISDYYYVPIVLVIMIINSFISDCILIVLVIISDY